MNDPRTTKKWKAIEVQIKQASEFLNEHNLFKLDEHPLESNKFSTREKELKQAMLELESIAKKWLQIRILAQDSKSCGKYG